MRIIKSASLPEGSNQKSVFCWVRAGHRIMPALPRPAQPCPTAPGLDLPCRTPPHNDISTRFKSRIDIQYVYWDLKLSPGWFLCGPTNDS